ncbi:Coiled-coil domain containing 124 family protein [Cardiosporidium cionae]|uniref:Coiled-coil domain containing 124 family protein n=1 Tax=Cardiosporidium cionae TaxID=476202 RepID=A0ABQ7JFU9_9APIC|nr:Coiled-coil domain containing 124 family protein [Cardiosporidium cionae]|eukprot:KAF8822890.1 Coiled-coil domain containing 124 family protein [Cardiosporidium cionae]
MPRWAGGVNLKAQEALEKKRIAKEEKKRLAEKKLEDSKWQEIDKNVKAALERKADAKLKIDQRNQRKAEVRQLTAKEDEQLSLLQTAYKAKKNTKGEENTKLCQAEIALRLLMSDDTKKKMQAYQTDTAKNESFIESNINQLARDKKKQEDAAFNSVAIASGLGDALNSLNADEIVIDKHPERRAKMMYMAFEKRIWPSLREEYPTSTRSQLKQLAFKQVKNSKTYNFKR